MNLFELLLKIKLAISHPTVPRATPVPIALPMGIVSESDDTFPKNKFNTKKYIMLDTTHKIHLLFSIRQQIIKQITIMIPNSMSVIMFFLLIISF